MRRRLLVLAAAVAVPITGGAISHGCSDEPPFDDACQWLQSPENCYAEFHADMLRGAGPDNPNGDCRTGSAGTPQPTQATSSSPGVSNGSFQMRAMLDTCILNGGGSVTVNPPIDLTNFPANPYADPITYTFSFINEDGNECGEASYTSPHGFSITIDPPPDAGTTAVFDGGDASVTEPADAGAFTDAAPYLPYGTYAQVNPAGRDSFDVTCPSGDSFHFTLDEVNLADPAAGACPAVASLLPTASLQVFLGGTDVQGAVSLAITYPPTAPTLASSLQYPAGSQPETVVYFNCAIPGQMETCADGVKDGLETDIDCGGPQQSSKLYCGMCPARCGVGQNCLCDDDCSPPTQCVINPMSGMRQCGSLASDAGVNTHFPICSYEADAGLPCVPTPTTSAAGTGGAGGASGASGSSSSGMGGAGGKSGAGGSDGG